jgi:hypothetical protein
MKEQATVGQEIWNQLGIMTKMSVGARKAVVGDIHATIQGEDFPYQLHFNVNRGRSQKVLVGLNGRDYYDVRFVQINKMGQVVKVFGSFDNVSVWDLNQTILQADRE